MEIFLRVMLGVRRQAGPIARVSGLKAQVAEAQKKVFVTATPQLEIQSLARRRRRAGDGLGPTRRRPEQALRYDLDGFARRRALVTAHALLLYRQPQLFLARLYA